jgi:hypothetical protein
MKNKDLLQLVANLNAVIGSQETKVQKKLFKIQEKISKYLDEYNKQVEELRLDNASVDEKGILILNEKSDYKFSKEGIKKLTKDIEALNDKEFDFQIINVVNPIGLNDFTFLQDWVTGVEFNKQEEEEL